MTTVDGNSLAGVSATTLWTLRNRATAAKRPDGVIHDPWAVELFDAIGYDYAKFGKANQFHPLRALTFDAVTADYLRTYPTASVVALAEGLQTSLWRLDRSWMDRVDTSHGVFITAEGLLMYLDPADVRGLIADCAARFPGGRMMFDSIPHWASRRTLKGQRMSNRYVAPPMPFGLTADEGVALAREIPGVCAARDIALLPGRGLSRLMARLPLDRIGPLRRTRPSITLLEFSR